MFESLPSNEETAVNAWFGAKRDTVTDSLLAVEVEIATALDAGDRSQVFRLQQDRAVLSAQIDHLAELDVHLTASSPQETITNLTNHVAKLSAVLASQNSSAELLDDNLDTMGKVLLGTEEMKVLAKLKDTAELLDALASDIEDS